MKRAARILGTLALVMWFVFAIAICALRFYILPWLADEKDYFSQILSAQLGTTLTIEKAEPFWNGLEPGMLFQNVKIAHSKRAHEVAFALENARAVFSWKSFLNLFRHDLPSFSWLQAQNLSISLEKKDNQLWLAGFLMAPNSGDSNFVDWLFSQNHVRFQNMRVHFSENDAPIETFHNIQFLMDNKDDAHRVQLEAMLPTLFAHRVDLRAEFFGRIQNGAWMNALEEKKSTFYAHIENANLSKIFSYINWPLLEINQGRSDLKAWAHFETHYRGEFSAQLAFKESPITATAELEGNWHKDEGLWGGLLKIVNLNAHAPNAAPLNIQEWEIAYHRARWELNADHIALKTMQDYAQHFDFLKELKKFHVSGHLKNTHLSFFDSNQFAIQTQLQNVGIVQKDSMGFENFSGILSATPYSAALHLDSHHAAVILPQVFDEPKIQLDSLTGEVSLEKNGEKSTVNAQKISFSNADFSGAEFNIFYQNNGNGRGIIDSSGKIASAIGARVWRYLPSVIHKDVRLWVKNAVQAGKGTDGKLILKGNLDKFPFKNKADGIFEISAKAHNAVLEYAPGWPKLEKINAQMTFGLGMKITSNSAQILGVDIPNATAEIPDFTVPDEILFAKGKAQGSTQNFLQFINEAPDIQRKTQGFTSEMRAQGTGALDLALELPVRHLNDSKVIGRFDFTENTFEILPELPEIKKASGAVQITEESVNAPKITGEVLGGKINGRFKNEKSDLKIELKAQTPVNNFLKHYGVPLENFIQGHLWWSAEITTNPSREFSLVGRSDFKNLISTLPAPLNKTEKDLWDFSLSGNNHQAVFSLKNKLKARVLLAEKKEIHIDALHPIDIAAWQNVFSDFENQQKNNFSTVNALFFSSPEILLNQKSFGPFNLKAVPQQNGWTLAFNNPNAKGTLLMQHPNRIRAHFSHLNIPEISDFETQKSKTFARFPDLELTVDSIFYKDNLWGSFQLVAQNNDDVWRISKWQLKNEDGELAGDGAWWHKASDAITHLRFDLKTQNAGAFLKHLYTTDTLEGGTGNAKGTLQWNDSPCNIDWKTLSGAMYLDIKNASFKKVAPGGAGRLLGLLSLQSIVQRLRFNFRDLVSEGLAFHRLSGDLEIKNGVLHTARAPLLIDAPAAQITFSGNTHLDTETLDVSIRIRPSLGFVTALGLAFVNPIAGAASALASTIGANPLDKIIYTHYQVGGTWQYPLILKDTQSSAATINQPQKEHLWLNTTTPY